VAQAIHSIMSSFKSSIIYQFVIYHFAIKGCTRSVTRWRPHWRRCGRRGEGAKAGPPTHDSSER